MEIAFTCFNCGVEIEADSELCGDQLGCPNCHTILLVPAAGIGPGARLSGFEVKRRIGVGGMGEVFLATQVALDRPVALKVLAPAMTRNPELLKRFLHEIQMAGKLDHPNIVSAFDAGEDDGYHYMAMSYVEGEDLADRLEREKQLSERETLEIGLYVAEALGYAWTKFGLLHRDIKPANIMLDQDGTVKLMDMGIAKTIAEDSKLTMVGLFVGTPYYMSPEQAQSLPDIDCRSDIYALGASMYHMVTGTRPFDAENAVGVLTKHVAEPLPDPRKRRADLSASTSALLVKMMAKKPAQRQQSWADLAEEIRLMLKSDTLLSEQAAAPRGHAPETMLGTRSMLDDAETLVQAQPTHFRPDPNDDDIPLLKQTPATARTRALPVDGPELGPGSTIVPAPPIRESASDHVPTPVSKQPSWQTVNRASSLLVYAIIGLVVVAVVAVVLVVVGKTRDRIDHNRVEIQERQAEIEREEREQVGDIDAEIGARITQAEVQAMEKEKLKRLQEMLDFARGFAKRNPYDIHGAIKHFDSVREHGQGTKFELAAAEEIRRLRKRLEQLPGEVMAKLARQVAPLETRGQRLRAAQVYESYSGPLAAETKGDRLRRADRLRGEAEALRLQIEWVREAWEQLRISNQAELKRVIALGRRSSRYEPVRTALKAEISQVEKLAAWPQLLVSTFDADRGNVITIRTTRGAMQVKVLRRVGSVVYCDNGGRELRLSVNELSAEELVQRCHMMPQSLTRSQILAIVAIRAGRVQDALDALAGRAGVLTDVLIGQAQGLRLRGTWDATQFGGDAYVGKPSIFRMLVTSPRALDLTFDARKIPVTYHIVGAVMHVTLGGKREQWFLRFDGENKIRLEPKLGLEINLSRR